MMLRPCACDGSERGASWMDAKALTCSPESGRPQQVPPPPPPPARSPTPSGGRRWPTSAVTEYTKTPTANPNVRQTIGSPEKIQPGERLPKAHCTTRKSSEKMTLTSPRTAKPTVTSASVTRVLTTVDSSSGEAAAAPAPARPAHTATAPALPGDGAGAGRNLPRSGAAGCRSLVRGPGPHRVRRNQPGPGGPCAAPANDHLDLRMLSDAPGLAPDGCAQDATHTRRWPSIPRHG